MNNFLNLPQEEKEKYFINASDIIGINPHLIEKDFWVCWLLKKLFEIKNLSNYLTFKGGTSLSKVFKLIERFSEDVDLSIEKTFFGFINDKDPSGAKSNKARNKLLENLKQKCGNFVRNDLIKLLEDKIKGQVKENWSLELDKDDPNTQTILFYYPSYKTKKVYVKPVVKIEMGARSEHWPVSEQIITPYLYDAIPNSLKDYQVKVKVLNAERTFWEKATILHMYANFPENRNVAIRQSRHYYDFYCMLNSEVKELAINNDDLLVKVAEHKSIYFRCGWAKYNEAHKGSLKLIPDKKVLNEMEKDYMNMQEMIFAKKPEWQEIIETIKIFETEFNV